MWNGFRGARHQTVNSKRLVDALFDRFYSKERGYGRATIRFHELLRDTIPHGAQILEIGAGPANETTEVLSTIGGVSAVDVSPEVLANAAATTAIVYDGRRLPYESCVFDACVSNYVLEHVTNPQEHFGEVARVLKPGGVYIVRTPNLFHYVALVSRMLPHAIHIATANRLRGLPGESHDPWPTVYRANRPPVLEALARQSGLTSSYCRTVECEPSYAKGSLILFFPMMFYERLVNSAEVFSGFRASINAVFRKPAVVDGATR